MAKKHPRKPNADDVRRILIGNGIEVSGLVLEVQDGSEHRVTYIENGQRKRATVVYDRWFRHWKLVN